MKLYINSKSKLIAGVIFLCLIGIIVSVYYIEISVKGGHEYSRSPTDWANFSLYFSGILGPILAAAAAFLAYMSMQNQINIIRDNQSINQQSENYLKYIDLIGEMIDKRWRVIIKYYGIDYEEIPDNDINIDHVQKNMPNYDMINYDVIKTMKLFHDYSNAIQWYTSIHKRQISIENHEFPCNEWSHFSTGLIRERSKQIKFCYIFSQIIEEKETDKNSDKYIEAIIFKEFFSQLQSQKLL